MERWVLCRRRKVDIMGDRGRARRWIRCWRRRVHLMRRKEGGFDVEGRGVALMGSEEGGFRVWEGGGGFHVGGKEAVWMRWLFDVEGAREEGLNRRVV